MLSRTFDQIIRPRIRGNENSRSLVRRKQRTFEKYFSRDSMESRTPSTPTYFYRGRTQREERNGDAKNKSGKYEALRIHLVRLGNRIPGEIFDFYPCKRTRFTWPNPSLSDRFFLFLFSHKVNLGITEFSRKSRPIWMEWLLFILSKRGERKKKGGGGEISIRGKENWR